jgi:hypothetical protein
MAQSFLALLVIPDLKLSDRGLFDGRAFRFLDLFTAEGFRLTGSPCADSTKPFAVRPGTGFLTGAPKIFS